MLYLAESLLMRASVNDRGRNPGYDGLILRDHAKPRCSVSPHRVSANLTGKDNSLIQIEDLRSAWGLAVRGYRGLELDPLDKITRPRRFCGLWKKGFPALICPQAEVVFSRCHLHPSRG